MMRPAGVRRLFIRYQTTRFFQLPPPTWSLKDLNLTASSEPISEEELKTLAKRACIDVDKIKDTESLRKDVADMLYCMEQVRNVKLPDMTAEEIYDAPRGLTAAPVRKANEATAAQEEEAQQVRKELLQSKGTKYGGHEYFSIITKREENSSSREEKK